MNGPIRAAVEAADTQPRPSVCGLTECSGKPMCARCLQWADMGELRHLLPEGARWQDPLTPGLLRALLRAALPGLREAGKPVAWVDAEALVAWRNGYCWSGLPTPKKNDSRLRDPVPLYAAPPAPAPQPEPAPAFWTTMAHVDAAKAGKPLYVSERQGVEFCVPVRFGKPQPADDFRD